MVEAGLIHFGTVSRVRKDQPFNRGRIFDRDGLCHDASVGMPEYVDLCITKSLAKTFNLVDVTLECVKAR